MTSREDGSRALSRRLSSRRRSPSTRPRVGMMRENKAIHVFVFREPDPPRVPQWEVLASGNCHRIAALDTTLSLQGYHVRPFSSDRRDITHLEYRVAHLNEATHFPAIPESSRRVLLETHRRPSGSSESAVVVVG